MIGIQEMGNTRLEDLPESAQALVKAIQRGNGGWLKRQDIAAYMDKTKLNAGEIATLDMLASLGYIEARAVPTYAPSKTRWEYKSK